MIKFQIIKMNLNKFNKIMLQYKLSSFKRIKIKSKLIYTSKINWKFFLNNKNNKFQKMILFRISKAQIRILQLVKIMIK